MEAWEQEIKRAVNPALPGEIEQQIHHTLAQIPRKDRKVKMFYAVPAVALAGFLLFGATSISPVIAETVSTIPVLGSIFETIGTIGEKKASELGLPARLNQQVHIDGQTVTFTESLYDGSGIIHIGYVRQSGSSDFLNNIQVTIDGKRLTDYNGGASGERFDNGTFAGIYTIETSEKLEDSFNLRLSSPDLSWSVELPVKRQGSTTAHTIHETKKWQNRSMIYEQIGLYPSATILSVRWLMNEYTDGYTLLNYQIFDDQGRVLQPFGNRASGQPAEDGKYQVKSYFTYEPLEDVPKSLTIRPYLGNGSATGSETKKLWNGKEIELSQGKAGSIKIQQVYQKNNRLTLTYEVNGELTYQRSSRIWLENQDGERYETLIQPHRVEGSVRQYQAAFAVKDQNDKIIIGTGHFEPIKYLDELEISLDFNE
ncbi:hypothetical protein C2I18_27375 [Paenibacillus sp. PK3_47]|uniref:DUF4179 domain-containing protein n=1 Tax=Paenibacillus sp. PK3_47 TaxID=2072642 RepID=UPI00201D95AA|nr:DUF4179 domain-containing protein [Paenibacillus sp. PK3_47]UQZ36927.1 hypothetical protein C2I18_27375 [Paenibacillus sp. PK3_47]